MIQIVDFNELEWHDAIIHSVIIDKMGDFTRDQIKINIEWPENDYDEEGPLPMEDSKDYNRERHYNSVVFDNVVEMRLDIACHASNDETIMWAEYEEVTRITKNPEFEYEFMIYISGAGKYIVEYTNTKKYQYTFNTASTNGLITIIAEGFHLEEFDTHTISSCEKQALI